MLGRTETRTRDRMYCQTIGTLIYISRDDRRALNIPNIPKYFPQSCITSHERRVPTTEMRMVRWAMGVSLSEHRRNEEILEEAKVEQIATVMRRRRLDRFGHVKRRDETENIRAVVEMKMEGKRPRGRPKSRWKVTIRRDIKAWSIREEWATDRAKWKSLCKTRYPVQGDSGER